MKLFTPCVLAALVAASGCTKLKPAAHDSMQTPQRFEKKLIHTAKLDYLLHLPPGYKAKGQPWPLMIFLHGAGERGSDVQKVAAHGPPKIVKTKRDFPFVLVSPLCPANRVWRDDELSRDRRAIAASVAPPLQRNARDPATTPSCRPGECKLH